LRDSIVCPSGGKVQSIDIISKNSVVRGSTASGSGSWDSTAGRGDIRESDVAVTFLKRLDLGVIVTDKGVQQSETLIGIGSDDVVGRDGGEMVLRTF